MITRKVAPALGAGCTVLVKPAEDTPLTALAVAQLAGEAGFPPGVLNLITTSNPAEVGEVLTGSALVRKLSFTGSTAVGKILMQKSASTLKRLSMELGGNAPFIVLDDADIDRAVEGAIASKYRNAGQTCICANRIFVQEKVFTEFKEKFITAVMKLRVGNGLEGAEIGPLINSSALEKVNGLVQEAAEKGANIELGGGVHELGGTFFQPTVVSNLNTEMAISREEIFGPIAPLYSFRTDDEAIQLANDTQSGLAAYFFGKEMSRIWKMAEALEYGMVGINTGMISNPAAPFGGVKESGFGREGSQYGMEEYLEMKYVCLQIDG